MPYHWRFHIYNKASMYSVDSKLFLRLPTNSGPQERCKAQHWNISSQELKCLQSVILLYIKASRCSTDYKNHDPRQTLGSMLGGQQITIKATLNFHSNLHLSWAHGLKYKIWKWVLKYIKLLCYSGEQYDPWASIFGLYVVYHTLKIWSKFDLS